MPNIRHLQLPSAIRETVHIMRENGLDTSTALVMETFLEIHGDVYEETKDQLAREGLSARLRQVLKASIEANSQTEQMVMSLGIGEINLPSEVPVPRDEGDLDGPQQWKPLGTLTVDEIKKHNAMLLTQISADTRKYKNMTILLGRVVEIIGEHSGLTVGDAARIASEKTDH